VHPLQDPRYVHPLQDPRYVQRTRAGNGVYGGLVPASYERTGWPLGSVRDGEGGGARHRERDAVREAVGASVRDSEGDAVGTQ
jgi:hypothetical protein